MIHSNPTVTYNLSKKTDIMQVILFLVKLQRVVGIALWQRYLEIREKLIGKIITHKYTSWQLGEQLTEHQISRAPSK